MFTLGVLEEVIGVFIIERTLFHLCVRFFMTIMTMVGVVTTRIILVAITIPFTSIVILIFV